MEQFPSPDSQVTEASPAAGDAATTGFLTEAFVPAGAERQQLLSFMVHELRNPLATALWASEMLVRHLPTETKERHMADLATRAVRRLRALIEDVFALERLPETADPGACDLRRALEHAVEAPEPDPRPVAAHIEGPRGLVVCLNPGLVGKLMQACLRRAAYVNPGPTVKIRLEDEGDAALVTFHRDDVSAAALDPPVMASQGSEGSGTTFSLMLARLAAMRLGAALWVEPAGSGSYLRIRFPRPHRRP